MSLDWSVRYSRIGWFVTVLVTGAIIVALYSRTKEYTPSNYAVMPGRFPRMMLEDGYLAEHWPEKKDPTTLIASGRKAGLNIVQMPKAGVAYFDPDVPQDVVEKIVLDFEKNKDNSSRSNEPWHFYVHEQINWPRLSG